MGRTYVVGYDGSDAARRALAYAGENVDGGRLFVVVAVAPPPEWLGDPGWQQMVDREHARGNKLLEEAGELVPATVQSTTELIEGRAADAIVDVATTRDA